MRKIGSLLESEEKQTSTLIIKPIFLYIATAIKRYATNNYTEATKFDNDLYNSYFEFNAKHFKDVMKNICKINEEDLIDFAKHSYNDAYKLKLIINNSTVKLTIFNYAKIKSEPTSIKIDFDTKKNGKDG